MIGNQITSLTLLGFLIHKHSLRITQVVVVSGGALPLIFCMHVHSRPTYRGAIYLAKKITRYGFFQNKGKCVYFETPYQ